MRMKSPSSSVKGEGTCPGRKAPQGPQESDYSSTEPNEHRNPNKMFLQRLLTSSDENLLPPILFQAAATLCLPLALPCLVISDHKQPTWPSPTLSQWHGVETGISKRLFFSYHHTLSKSHLHQAAALVHSPAPQASHPPPLPKKSCCLTR